MEQELMTNKIRVWVECDSEFTEDVSGEDWDKRSERDKDEYLRDLIIPTGRVRWGWSPIEEENEGDDSDE